VGKQQGGIMTVPAKNKHKDYARYAATCLEMVAVAPDQEARAVQREMAAEWLRLAEAIVEQSTPIKIKRADMVRAP
jgi:hypothetical protein